MTLTELRYVVAVSQEKHFGKAASRCYVSQPTLSIAIKKLEEELGVIIFDRSASEISTTEVGYRIVTQAQIVLEEAERLKLIANLEQSELSYPFKLGLIFTIAPYILPNLIISLRTLAPEMQLVLDENYTHNLTDQLKQGDLDAIVVAEPFHESSIETIPLYDEQFFVIVPHGHPFEQLDAVTTAEIAEEQVLLLTEGNCFRDQVLSSCKELAEKQKISGLANSLQGSSINTVRHMVASGIGISIVPATSLTEKDHLFFSIIPFAGDNVPQRRVVLASRRNFIRKQALDCIKQAILKSKLIGAKLIQS